MKLLREPLLHFLLIGGAFFVADSLMNPEPAPNSEHIVVRSGQIEHLVATFARTRQRSPNEAELKDLIDQHVREEVLSREAVKLGLDRDDVIIRRRLQQKMEFVAEDLAASAAPTEAELAAYLREHAVAFREPPRFTFQHIFLSPARRGAKIEADAASMLEALKAGGDEANPGELGDPSLLPPVFVEETARVIEGSFGNGFGDQLAALPVGTWAGPLRSSFGIHLVRVDARSEARSPELGDVRDLVLREWENERRLDANRALVEGLLAKYEVRIEWPSASAQAVP